MASARILLVGDFDAAITAHRAIGSCFALARNAEHLPVEPVWVGTETITPGDLGALAGGAGVWCVPGSPYRKAAGALWAIRLARERSVPFLGTCGGFQHALLEYARTVLGRAEADHAETNPQAQTPLIHLLACSLVEQEQTIDVSPGHQFRQLYGGDSGSEGFHCRYGLNPNYERWFAAGPLEIAARAQNGEVRAVMLREHPFFVGTLFQPERRALNGSLHPLVRTFFEACLASQSFAKDSAVRYSPRP